ncbi:MAG: class I SAM-dependent methyltransferase [Candidatus Aenigmatarchaeota archaeon]
MEEENYILRTVEGYNKLASLYFKYCHSHTSQEIKNLKKFYDYLFEKKIVIDIGCGTGKDGKFLKDNYGVETIGIDLSEEMLKISKKYLPHIIKADMRYLPLRSCIADGIISNSSLVHLKKEDKIKTCKEVYRVLKKYGIFYVVIQNKYNIRYFLRQLKFIIKNRKLILGYSDYDYRNWYYESYWSFKEILSYLHFRILSSTKNPFARFLIFYSIKEI